jgi:hypothetical protein
VILPRGADSTFASLSSSRSFRFADNLLRMSREGIGLAVYRGKLEDTAEIAFYISAFLSCRHPCLARVVFGGKSAEANTRRRRRREFSQYTSALFCNLISFMHLMGK